MEQQKATFISALALLLFESHNPAPWKTYYHADGKTPIAEGCTAFAVGLNFGETTVVFILESEFWPIIAAAHAAKAPIDINDAHTVKAFESISSWIQQRVIKPDKLQSLSPVKAGLHGKYLLAKADGSDIAPYAKYFCLRYDADSEDGESARSALLRYAELVFPTNPDLANGLAKDLRLEGA